MEISKGENGGEELFEVITEENVPKMRNDMKLWNSKGKEKIIKALKCWFL